MEVCLDSGAEKKSLQYQVKNETYFSQTTVNQNTANEYLIRVSAFVYLADAALRSVKCVCRIRMES